MVEGVGKLEVFRLRVKRYHRRSKTNRKRTFIRELPVASPAPFHPTNPDHEGVLFAVSHTHLRPPSRERVVLSPADRARDRYSDTTADDDEGTRQRVGGFLYFRGGRGRDFFFLLFPPTRFDVHTHAHMFHGFVSSCQRNFFCVSEGTITLRA